MSWTYGIAPESIGAFFVYIFFIVSALTMMIAHGSDFASSISLPAARTFYLKRVARIMPLLVLVATVVLIERTLRAAPDPFDDLARAYLTGTALFGLQLPGMASNAVAAWSLGIEAVFYVVFPIVALMASAATARALLVALTALVLGQHAMLWLLRGQEGEAFWFLYANPLAFAPFFALGFLIHRWQARPSVAAFWLLVVTLAAIGVASIVYPVNLYRDHSFYLALTALSGVSVATAFKAKVPSIVAPVGTYLGNISYALYLTHWFAYRIAGEIGELLGQPEAQVWLFAAVALPLAHAVYFGFERPAQRYLLRGAQPAKVSPAVQ